LKADTVDLAAIFGKPVRYLVPMFQRPYVWRREEQWEPLWEDIQAVLERQLDDTPLNDALPHFLGAVVLDQVLVPTGMLEARYIIDGQQRLTTLQLFIAAARSVATEHGQAASALMLEKLLFNDEFLLKSPDDRFKVLPTTFDRVAFREAIEAGGDGGTPDGHRLTEGYRYFRGALAEWVIAAEPTDIDARLTVLSAVLWKLLVVVAIDLDQRDNAQVIFETLNARGTPLLAADLIKNHIFQAAVAENADIDALYARYWQQLDTDWWRAEVQQGRLRRPRLDIFMNHWLAMRLGHEVVSHLLFPEFKRYLVGRADGVEAFLASLATYARVYETFENSPETTPTGRFFYRLNVMEVTTAYPALLWIFGPDGIADEQDRETAIKAVERWLVRRMLVRAATKNYNTIFLSLLGRLKGATEVSSEVVADFLHGLTGESQYWPTDDQVIDSLRVLPIYTTLTRARLRMVLEAIEDQLRTGFTEPAQLGHDLTIEHILPQEWRPNWPLAPEADSVQASIDRDALKQTLGNLTLVTNKLNPSMSNGPWEEKRDALRTHSILRLTADVRDAKAWDEDAIRARTEAMCSIALAIWPNA